MEFTKIISFIGMERCDLIVYLVNVLKTKSIRTLVIDNSCNQDLFGALRRPDSVTDYLENGRVVFMRNKCVEVNNTGAFEKFDVVIIYHGLNVNYNMLAMSNYLVLQTDYIPVHLQEIREMVDLTAFDRFPKENSMIIYRDKGSGKISEAVIRKELEIENAENEEIIFYDEGNFNNYLNFCWNGSQETKGVTGEVKNAINFLKVWLIGVDKKKRGEK